MHHLPPQKIITLFLSARLNIQLTVQNGGRVENNPSFSGGIRIEPRPRSGIS